MHGRIATADDKDKDFMLKQVTEVNFRDTEASSA